MNLLWFGFRKRQILVVAFVVARPVSLKAMGGGSDVTSLSMSQQNLSKDDGIVVGLVMSRVDERDGASPVFQVAQSVQFIAMLMEFRRISPAEFPPSELGILVCRTISEARCLARVPSSNGRWRLRSS